MMKEDYTCVISIISLSGYRISIDILKERATQVDKINDGEESKNRVLFLGWLNIDLSSKNLLQEIM